MTTGSRQRCLPPRTQTHSASARTRSARTASALAPFARATRTRRPLLSAPGLGVGPRLGPRARHRGAPPRRGGARLARPITSPAAGLPLQAPPQEPTLCPSPLPTRRRSTSRRCASSTASAAGCSSSTFSSSTPTARLEPALLQAEPRGAARETQRRALPARSPHVPRPSHTHSSTPPDLIRQGTSSTPCPSRPRRRWRT